MRDEEPDHGDGSPTCCLVSGPLILVLGEDDGNNKVAQTHRKGSQSKRWATADSVDVQDRWDRGEKHDNTDNTCRQ